MRAKLRVMESEPRQQSRPSASLQSPNNSRTAQPHAAGAWAMPEQSPSLPHRRAAIPASAARLLPCWGHAAPRSQPKTLPGTADLTAWRSPPGPCDKAAEPLTCRGSLPFGEGDGLQAGSEVGPTRLELAPTGHQSPTSSGLCHVNCTRRNLQKAPC